MADTPPEGETTSSPARKKVLKARKPNATRTKPCERIDGRNLKMRFDDYQSEAAVAAYLFFNDQAKFRHLMLSYPILDAFVVWKEHSSCTTEIKPALEFLDGVPDPDTKYPLSLEEIIAKYGAQTDPEESELQSDQDKHWRTREIKFRRIDLLASILRYLVKRTGDLLDRTEAERGTEQARANASFEALLGLKMPLSHDITQVNKPLWGPIEGFREGPLEPFNRAYLLLRRLMKIVHGKNAWKSQFLSSRAPFEARIIHLDSVPMWMRQVEGQNERAPITPRSVRVENLPHSQNERAPTTRRSVSVENLPHGSKLRLSKTSTIHAERMQHHKETFLAPRGLKLPRSGKLVQCLPDPRVFQTRESFLDGVRSQLNFVRLRVQFFGVKLIVCVEGEEDHELQVYGQCGDFPWGKIQNEFEKDSYSCILEYTLRPLSGTDHGPMESTSVPLSLASHIGIGPDGDLQTLDSDVPRVSQPSEDVGESASFGREKSETEKRVADFWASLTTQSNSRTMQMPADIFPPDKPGIWRQMLNEYSQINVYEPQGLRDWQLQTIGEVMASSVKPTGNLEFAMGKAVLQSNFCGDVLVSADTKVQKELVEYEQHVSQTMLSTDVGEKEIDFSDFYIIQEAFAGSSDPTDSPNIVDSRLLLGMKRSKPYEHDKKLDMCRTSTMNINSDFLDIQITGAAWMLAKTLGFVPNLAEDPDTDAVKAASERLRTEPTSGGILSDDVGTGKTYTTSLCMSALAKHLAKTKTNEHRPMLLLVPNGTLFSQWQDILHRQFPELELIVSNDDRPTHSIFANKWISSSAMRKAPQDLSDWPRNLRYVFNKKDERASKTVLLVPYQAFSDRSMKTLNTDMFMDSEGLKKWSTKLRKIVLREFEQSYTSRFSAVFCDEGHRIRHEETGIHQCVSLLDAPINWIITATPEVNSALVHNTDEFRTFAGFLKFFGVQCRRGLHSKKHSNKKKPWIVFKEVQSLPDGDPLRLLPVQPDHIKALISSKDLAEIANYSGYMRKLVVLKRTTASSLAWDSSPASAHVSLKNLMPKHKVETIEIGYAGMEAPEAQALHRIYARIYEETIDDWVKDQWKKNSGKGDKLDDDAPRLARVRRALSIVSASTLLGRFDLEMKAKGLDTLVENIRDMRTQECGVSWFIDKVRKTGDFLPVGDRQKDIAYLCFGGPKLRMLLRQVRETVLNATRPRKLLVIDETPLVAWLEEMLLQHMHIDARVLHADLDTAERDALVKDFNDPNRGPQVLILLYNVSSQGVNMHKACSDALVTSSGINASAEVQAWGRLIRIAQKDTVHIVRCQVLNSYDQFRDSKQRDKQKLILALNTPSPAMKVLLVNLLNAANVEVKALHDSNLTSLFRNKRENAVLGLRAGVEDDKKLSNDVLEDEFTLAGKSVSDVRRALRKDCEKRESFNPDLFALATQLRLDPKRVYTEEDLNDNAVYGRALGLLFRVKFGQRTENFRLSPIIRYDALAPEISRAIEAQVEAFYHNLGRALEQQNDGNEFPVSAEQVVREMFPQTAETYNGDGDANSANQEPRESQEIRAWEAFWDVEMTDGDGTTHPGPGEDQDQDQDVGMSDE
ncbi:uncharacterized protein J3D65DRAFT_682132 [Phyllosticta citribraziliensis]|uniref:Uncharacterized protein n=1 Tax=Phyllosticta citribraziliensis TaxID=989973 RepID=A0ABR1M9L5_9PEZI